MAIGGISGIGQLQGLTHLSGALSLGGAPAAVRAQTGKEANPSASVNLTAAAKPAFDALLALNAGLGSGKGPVSFSVVAPLRAPVPVLSSTPSLPPSRTPEYVVPSNATLLGRLTATVAQIAIAAIYPAPIFSFSA